MLRIHLLCLFILCAVVQLANSQEESAPPEEAAVEETDEFKSVLRALREAGLEVPANNVKGAALEALVSASDPKGALLEGDAADRMVALLNGHVFSPGVDIQMSNGFPVVAGFLDLESEGAEKLHPGDRILQIGEVEVVDSSIVHILQQLRKEEEETLTLMVVSGEETTNSITLACSKRQLAPIDATEELPAGLGYVRVNGLYEEAAESLAEQLQQWSDDEHTGVVLDLRGAGGDDLAGAAKVAGLYGEANALLFSFRDRGDQDLEVYKDEDTTLLDIPTMVLIDERTHGAAEVLAASLKDSIRGCVLLGRETAGDALLRETIDIRPGRKLYVATRKLVTAAGTVYEGHGGVQPDIGVSGESNPAYDYEHEASEVKPETLEEEKEDRALRARLRGDNDLRRAVDLLLGLKALNIRVQAPTQPSSS